MDKRLFERRNFLWRLFTFSGYISVGQFWSELGIRLISFFCATIFLSILLSVTVPGEVEDVLRVLYLALPILGLLWLVPILALTRRRLRDGGNSAKTYLWLLIPGIGMIVFLVKLCARSVPREPDQIWFES